MHNFHTRFISINQARPQSIDISRIIIPFVPAHHHENIDVLGCSITCRSSNFSGQLVNIRSMTTYREETTYIQKARSSHQRHIGFSQVTERFLVGCRASTPDFGKALEDANHALPVLGKECTCLLHYLLVVESSHEHSRNDYSEDGKEKIIVFPESIGIINIYDG